MIGLEMHGLFGLIILAADVWAIINVLQSSASTGKKAAWVVGVLVFPVVGFVVWLIAGPRDRPA
jgi:succinate dehydrogenase/fumarate reductase cytochrome b subunit